MLPVKNKLVNKKEMYELFVKMKKINEMEESPKKDRELRKVIDQIGEVMLLLITRLSSSRSFWGYSFKSDFVQNACLIASKAILRNKFDTERSHEPFSYFTSVAKWAFIQTIKKEKRKTINEFNYIKEQLTESQAKLDYRDHIQSEIEFLRDLMDIESDGTYNVSSDLIKMEEETYDENR